MTTKSVLLAQKSIYEDYIKYVYTIVKSKIFNLSHVEEIVQEAFIKIFDNIHKYDNELGEFKNWIATITINECNKYIKKYYKYTITYLEEKDIYSLKTNNGNETINNLIYEDKILQIKNYISKYSDKEQSILTLRYLEFKSFNDIKDALNINSSNPRVIAAKHKQNIIKIIIS